MRKVTFKDYDSDAKKWVSGIGFFHQWGNSFTEFNEGPVGNYTYGLVEDIDGRIWEVAPHHIGFIPEPIETAIPHEMD